MLRYAVFMILLSLFGCRAAIPDTPIQSMEYCINNATRYPTFHFTLSRDEAGRYLLTNATGCEPEDAETIEVSTAFADSIKQIVEEEHMLSYRKEYSSFSNRFVSGGSMWVFQLRFADSQTSISSSGYVAQPKGNGLIRIRQLCLDTWDSLHPNSGNRWTERSN